MRRWLGTVLLVGLCGMADMRAQQSLAEANRLHAGAAVHMAAEDGGPSATLDEALRGMFAEADVVFAGTVTRVEPVDGAVLVRFRVDDAIRGVTSEATFTLREWSGLWVDEPSRYLAGERRLMLLHGVSAAGYASPVRGSRGAIRLRGDGVQSVADLRWIATDVNAAVSPVQAMSVSLAAGLNTVSDSGAVDGMLLTDMLHAWQRDGVTQ